MCMYMHIWSLYCDRFVYPIVTPYMAVPVEIKHYLVAYFDRITAFEALKCRTSFKGGALMCWIKTCEYLTHLDSAHF